MFSFSVIVSNGQLIRGCSVCVCVSAGLSGETFFLIQFGFFAQFACISIFHLFHSFILLTSHNCYPFCACHLYFSSFVCSDSPAHLLPFIARFIGLPCAHTNFSTSLMRLCVFLPHKRFHCLWYTESFYQKLSSIEYSKQARRCILLFCCLCFWILSVFLIISSLFLAIRVCVCVCLSLSLSLSDHYGHQQHTNGPCEWSIS